MRGAETFGLNEDLSGRGLFGRDPRDILAARPDNDGKRVRPRRRRALQDMAENRQARHFMQHLRQGGFHPRALAGGKDDHQAASCGHGDPLVQQHFETRGRR